MARSYCMLIVVTVALVRSWRRRLGHDACACSLVTMGDATCVTGRTRVVANES